MTEVARVVSAPGIKVGRWCAFAAVVLWVFRETPWAFLGNLPGAGWWRTAFILVLMGLAAPAGHDALMWLFEVHKALKEKPELEAKGLSSDIQRAHAKEVDDAVRGQL